MNNIWKFTEIPNFEELSFNKVLEKFYDFGVEGLVRENIQNSLDGKLPDGVGPVSVRIETGMIYANQIPGIEEIKARISGLKAYNQYTIKTIEHMQDRMKAQRVAYISFEDSNTKGLKNALKGQTNDPEDTWSAYAYNKGVHSIEVNEATEQSRGGSHGIGKIASNAASDIYMMFFANCDENKNMHLGGTVQLIEHAFGSKKYRSTGYFTDQKEGNFYPYENTFDPIFNKFTRGLKIIIPYFRKQFNDEIKIVKSVCDNFFLAILENKLVVEVNHLIIDVNTIQSIIEDPMYYHQILEENKTDFTPIYLNTYLHMEKQDLEIEDLYRVKHQFDLYFNYDKRIQRGRVGIVRTVGMKIEDKKIPSNIMKPFNAVLIPKTVKEDSFLKSLENEAHTELSWEHFKDEREQRNARRFIKNLNSAIAEIIELNIRKNNPTDGLINTEDVLFDVETKFRSELSKNDSNISVDEGKNKRNIVKVNTGKRKNQDDSKKNKPEKKNNTRKVKGEIGEGKGNKDFYSIHPNLVFRATLPKEEKLKIDLTNEKHLEKLESCNLHVAIVDGMGKEYMNEYKLLENYINVLDINSGINLEVSENVMKEVAIREGKIELRMFTSERFNRSLKFAYYLEV